MPQEPITEALSDGAGVDLRVGLFAIRQEFLNLSELKHCLAVREKLLKKGKRVDDFGEVLVQERYLTPENLEYIHMISGDDPNTGLVTLKEIEDEFQRNIAEIKPGADFGRFHIASEIGRGGMGVVLKAIDSETDDEVALKILIGRDNASVRDIERFKKEATVMMPLQHDGIVKIYTVDRHRGLDYIAMEFVSGKSLKELVEANTTVDVVECLRIIHSAAEAVAFIHTEGIIHRDIKPENIMVRDEDGSAVLMDFGLAGWDKIEILSGKGSIGTPMYQPPEQAEVGGPFGKISPASDVYGLGATLYFLLTGHHPFTGRSVKEVRDKIKSVPPTPPSAHRPEIPQLVEALVLRAMKKRQVERFQTPKDFIGAIEKVLQIIDKGPRKSSSSTRSPLNKQHARRKATNPGLGKKTAPPKLKAAARRATDKQRRNGTSGESTAVRREARWHEHAAVLILGAVIAIVTIVLIGYLLVR